MDVDSGLVPRSFEYLTAEIARRDATRPGSRHVLRASYMELYNEQVRDLLNPAAADLAVRQRAAAGGVGTSFFVQGLTVVTCDSAADLHLLAREGHKNRSVASHNMNEHSSRSHSILTVYVESRSDSNSDGIDENGDEDDAAGAGSSGSNGNKAQWVRYGKISFIDLAGSETMKGSGIAGGEHLKEMNSINKSLFTLGMVISTLGDISVGRKPAGTFIPYRNSKLTMLLADSLGGNSLAMMVACVSPIAASIEETRRTLVYAATTRSIKNRPEAVVDPRTRLLWKFREECARLRSENAVLRNLLTDSGIALPST